MAAVVVQFIHIVHEGRKKAGKVLPVLFILFSFLSFPLPLHLPPILYILSPPPSSMH